MFILNKELSYYVGLAQTDGHFYETTQNRGKIVIELRSEDREVLERLASVLPVKSTIRDRTRSTNFKESYSSSALVVHDLAFRNLMKQYIPIGAKATCIHKPIGVSEVDYFRGIIDGDGSMGYTSNGFPFLSLVTKSEQLAKDYVDFLESITGKRKVLNRNKRDCVYNIMISKEDAQEVLKVLYPENSLCIKRKYLMASQCLEWKRPSTMRKQCPRKTWTSFEDNFILEHSLQESIDTLTRSKKSIKMRLYRLQKSNKIESFH